LGSTRSQGWRLGLLSVALPGLRVFFVPSLREGMEIRDSRFKKKIEVRVMGK